MLSEANTELNNISCHLRQDTWSLSSPKPVMVIFREVQEMLEQMTLVGQSITSQLNFIRLTSPLGLNVDQIFDKLSRVPN